MSKPLNVVGAIAGAVAVVASGGAALGLGLAIGGTVIGAGTIATFAGLAAGIANIGGSLLQKAPPARGSVSQILIAADAPQPYMIGEGYFAGVLRHDTAYGATLNKVPNPYRFMAMVYSGGGPIESITPWVDKAAVSSWYSGYLYTSTALGAVPASAVTPQWGTAPGWSSASKLSGQAAIGWSLKFDKDGKRFASGVPQLGAYGKWVKVYDPRKDSTFPGGSGAHRIGVETTYEWSENPALHAGTYAYGRYQNGKRVFGIGLPADGIDWSCIAAWASVCTANAWSIFGPIYEPGNRWANLKDIAAAGGAMPVASSGGRLSFKYSAPQVALDTITEADLAEGGIQITAQQSWAERVNTIIPRYISADHDWQQVAAGAVSVPTYVTEDGEEKVLEWPFNLVKDGAQAAQLAAYQLVDARELTPITIHLQSRFRHFRPGECLHIDLPDPYYDLVTDGVILQRQFDPVSMTVTLIMVSESTGKHAYALGRTATPPPTPALGQTGEERDELAAAAGAPSGYDTALISTSYTTDADPADGLISASTPSPNLLSNGDFGSSTIGWTLIGGGGSIANVAGVARVSPDATGFVFFGQSFPTVIGETYNVSGKVIGGTAAVIGFRKCDNGDPGDDYVLFGSGGAPGTYTGSFVATSTTSTIALQVNQNTFYGDFDDMTVEMVGAAPIVTITVEPHSRTYADKSPVSVSGAMLTSDVNSDPLTPSTTYHIYYDDPARVGGSVTMLVTTVSQDAATSSDNPGRHYVGSIILGAPGEPDVSTGGGAPPGWDPDIYCVADDTPILLADGSEAMARDLTVGTMLRTRHEATLEWGDYPVQAISFAERPVYLCAIGGAVIHATAEHRFWRDGCWVHARDIGILDGVKRIAKITVAEAHTYISAGVLSHNAKES